MILNKLDEGASMLGQFSMQQVKCEIVIKTIILSNLIDKRRKQT